MSSDAKWCLGVFLAFVTYDFLCFMFSARINEARYRRTARDVSWNREKR